MISLACGVDVFRRRPAPSLANRNDIPGRVRAAFDVYFRELNCADGISPKLFGRLAYEDFGHGGASHTPQALYWLPLDNVMVG